MKDIVKIVPLLALVLLMGLGGGAAVSGSIALRKIEARDAVIAEKQAVLDSAKARIGALEVKASLLIHQRDSLAGEIVRYSTSWHKLSQVERNEAQQRALEFLNSIKQ